MKKKVLGLISLLLLFNIVTVYAGTAIYGYYLGYEKVKVVVDTKEVDSTVPAIIIEDTTMVPLRAIAERLDVIVNWDSQLKTATLIKPNVNMLFTANPVYDKANQSYVVYSPFGKINKNQRYHFNFHVFCEVDNLPYENLEIKVVLKDPDNEIVQDGYVQTFDATLENSLQYINFFENIDFLKTGNYKVELLLKSDSTKNEFKKIGEKQILIK
ncbi:MAG: stalk domain-containing protein [Vulcanibacillus sp.]